MGSRRFDDHEPISDLALPDTLKAAAIRIGVAGSDSRRLRFIRSDLRKKIRKRRGNLFIVFAVDISDSMDSLSRISAARAAVVSILKTAYISRDRAALVVFRNRKARIVLPPTSSMATARKHLGNQKIGGATPLADALRLSLRLIVTERLRNPLQTAVLFVLSDGEANVPLVPGGNLDAEINLLASLIRKNNVRSYVVDSGGSGKGTERLVRLSETLEGTYKKITSPGDLRNILREGVVELEDPASRYNPT